MLLDPKKYFESIKQCLCFPRTLLMVITTIIIHNNNRDGSVPQNLYKLSSSLICILAIAGRAAEPN